MTKTTLFFALCLLLHFAASAQTPRQLPFSIGMIDSLHSGLLQETRTINVYLPQSYATDTAATYPVIYLLDGGADEDFIHISGLVQFFNFPWISRFPESIVVGIANTNRKRDFTFPVTDLDFLKPLGFNAAMFPDYGGSATFISFIEKELQPYVDRHYRTGSGKTLIGQSLGGLLASEILLRHTPLFDTYIIVSPSLWWDEASLLQQAQAFSNTRARPKVYLATGNEGQVMTGNTQKLAALLKKNRAVKVILDYLPNEDHATIGHQAVYNAFKSLYPVSEK
jgi:predicted alpha/beta superfamily hydrolase